jgi:hypothetical protein
VTSLLRPQGEGDGQDFQYRPFQATWVAGALYAGVLALLGVLSPDPIWPFFQSGASRLHVFFWMGVAVSPVMLLSLGWSYVLTPTEFVVKRFDRERFRVPLHELQNTTTVMGMTWLNFTTRRVHVVTGPDQDRLLFLQELEFRARRVGGKAPSPVPVQTGEGSVRLAVSALKFPDACVTCGERPSGKTELEASHWFGLPVVQGVKLEVPTCAVHRRREQVTRWLASITLLGLGQALSWALAQQRVGKELWVPGVILVGLVPGLLLLHVAGLLHLKTWIGWQALGVRTSDLSGDLRYVTLHSRSEALMRELLKLRE